ncbi:DUF2867 domain-containing protein [Streptomyces sp. AC512_CC834]|uniref:DUF2867 domain-containing protein n=1 Tax=Streptomyces sp. AC512_CC834 TaxID=2823691 RepID=UPI0035AE4729
MSGARAARATRATRRRRRRHRADAVPSARRRTLFHPRELAGRAYWWSVRPFHAVVFGAMARNIARAAARLPARVHTPAARGAGRRRRAFSDHFAVFTPYFRRWSERSVRDPLAGLRGRGRPARGYQGCRGCRGGACGPGGSGSGGPP